MNTSGGQKPSYIRLYESGKLDSSGIAYRGVLIRHLVLPNNLAGNDNALRFIEKKSQSATMST